MAPAKSKGQDPILTHLTFDSADLCCNSSPEGLFPWPLRHCNPWGVLRVVQAPLIISATPMSSVSIYILATPKSRSLAMIFYRMPNSPIYCPPAIFTWHVPMITHTLHV